MSLTTEIKNISFEVIINVTVDTSQVKYFLLSLTLIIPISILFYIYTNLIK